MDTEAYQATLGRVRSQLAEALSCPEGRWIDLLETVRALRETKATRANETFGIRWSTGPLPDPTPSSQWLLYRLSIPAIGNSTGYSVYKTAFSIKGIWWMEHDPDATITGWVLLGRDTDRLPEAASRRCVQQEP